MAKIKTDAEPLNSKRDLLAHGIWALHPDQTWMVLNTRGNWPKNAPLDFRSRKINPEALRVSVEAMQHVRERIETIIKAVELEGKALAEAMRHT